MFIIFCHKGNSNHNCIEISSHPEQNGSPQEIKGKQMLAKMQGEWSPYTLLLEM
jgi:hypothetical protein